MVKNQSASAGTQDTQVRSLVQEDPLEEETAAHSSVLAGIIPWTEEPDGLQSLGSKGVGHDCTTIAGDLGISKMLAPWKKVYDNYI